MEIALLANDSKKELMVQFCIAYCGILSKHNISTTKMTGKFISEATGLVTEQVLPGKQGGIQQISSRVAYNEIDVLVYFRDDKVTPEKLQDDNDLLRECDKNNVPTATNLATAEVLICALDRGELDWRNFLNPKSDYNRRKKSAN